VLPAARPKTHRVDARLLDTFDLAAMLDAMRWLLGLVLLLGVVVFNLSDRGVVLQRGWASTASSDAASQAVSGLAGRTVGIVGSGAEGGTPSRHVVRAEFAIVPLDDGHARFEAAVYVTSDADGSFKVALPVGRYRIVSETEARDPDAFKHRRKNPPMMLRRQTVVVRDGAYTDVEIVFVGEAP
jgi:hypothetical protein